MTAKRQEPPTLPAHGPRVSVKASPSALEHVVSYLLCGTPRTGSTLLCSALTATGVAGNPASYFREQDGAMWAALWGVPNRPDGIPDPGEFVRATLAAGRTSNGVFGARIMWGSLEVLLAKLPAAPVGAGELERISAALGPVDFIYLSRDDLLSQAVSWARAEQTAYWQQGDLVAAEPVYDEQQIARLEATIRQHNEAWAEWFGRCGIAPLEVKYERLEEHLGLEVDRILHRLGVRLPSGHEAVAMHRRQADEVNAAWKARYQATHRN